MLYICYRYSTGRQWQETEEAGGKDQGGQGSSILQEEMLPDKRLSL